MTGEERRAWDAWQAQQDPEKHGRFLQAIPSRKTSELLTLLLDREALWEEIGSRYQFAVHAALQSIFEEIDQRLPPREQGDAT